MAGQSARVVAAPVSARSASSSGNRGATVPVQPVWWLAPMPAPLSPWKYSWKSSRSRQCGSDWNVSVPPYTGRRPPVPRPPPRRVARERRRQPPRDLAGDLEQRHLAARAGRALHHQPLAVVAVQLEEPAEDDGVHREPDGAAPVRVPAEHRRVGLGREVSDRIALAAPLELARVLEVAARDRADPVRAEELVLVEQRRE